MKQTPTATRNAFHEMREYGGSFARTLADAWFKADPQNKAIIEDGFEEMISRYADMAIAATETAE